MNKKIIFVWVIAVLSVVLLVKNLKSMCVDYADKAGKCGWWLGNNFLFSGEQYHYLLILSPIIIGLILTYILNKNK